MPVDAPVSPGDPLTEVVGSAYGFVMVSNALIDPSPAGREG